MNRTLLLILCDFLLLNLLALTRWEKAEPPPAATAPVQEQPAAETAAQRDQDLVDVMKLSLEDERAARDELARQLQSTQGELEQREQNLSQLERQRAELQANLSQTQRSAQEIEQRAATAAREASLTKEQLAQLQRELEQRQQEAARQQREISQLEQQGLTQRQQIENLNVSVKVAEQEKVLLRENLENVRQEVVAVREEKQRVQEQAGVLAQGVGKLAEKSGELAEELRENRPINQNALFNEFLANRVQATLSATRPSFLGDIVRNKEARTVLVTDGQRTYALLHIEDTPFGVKETGADWHRFTGQLAKSAGGGAPAPVAELTFLSLDPRIAVVPLTAEQTRALGAKVYPLALDPFKFPEAVVVGAGGQGYGDIAFKLDPETPQYVRMDTRFFKRVFGDFSPGTGDLVFSKSGELLGLMVNRDYCAIVNNFLPAQRVVTGEAIADRKTSEPLNNLRARYLRLPLRLQ